MRDLFTRCQRRPLAHDVVVNTCRRAPSGGHARAYKRGAPPSPPPPLFRLFLPPPPPPHTTEHQLNTLPTPPHSSIRQPQSPLRKLASRALKRSINQPCSPSLPTPHPLPHRHGRAGSVDKHHAQLPQQQQQHRRRGRPARAARRGAARSPHAQHAARAGAQGCRADSRPQGAQGGAQAGQEAADQPHNQQHPQRGDQPRGQGAVHQADGGPDRAGGAEVVRRAVGHVRRDAQEHRAAAKDRGAQGGQEAAARARRAAGRAAAGGSGRAGGVSFRRVEQ
ncbi:adenylate cyclase [Gracilaria domingensis]|nr:adenylate cyclase [Gracilaria domingensis]